jgi:hypothetical protein
MQRHRIGSYGAGTLWWPGTRVTDSRLLLRLLLRLWRELLAKCPFKLLNCFPLRISAPSGLNVVYGDGREYAPATLVAPR